MATVELKHIRKEYEDGVVVKDFNLSIEDKEFVIFVGPSGCGKSTTLRMIAGIEEISDGELYIDGKRMNEVKASQRDVAMVFQNYALYPHMTVGENIGYSLRIQKVDKKERMEKVREVASLLGLENELNKLPKELSGGQKQRVAMGRAIVRTPKLFLMDEPLSNLDAKLRNYMRAEIQKLYNVLDTTFIYVTHDQMEAMTLGTKIVVLKDGDIQQVASPYDLYHYPENIFVAGFIGTPSMNFFDGVLFLDEEKLYVEIGGKKLLIPEERAKEIMKKSIRSEEIVVGVRAEDMIISEEGELKSTVNVYEMLGSEAYVYFDFMGKTTSARVDVDIPVSQGDEISFTFQMNHIHLFDKKTERRI